MTIFNVLLNVLYVFINDNIIHAILENKKALIRLYRHFKYSLLTTLLYTSVIDKRTNNNIKKTISLVTDDGEVVSANDSPRNAIADDDEDDLD